MRLLVVGASRFVGRHLLAACRARGDGESPADAPPSDDAGA